MTRQGSSRTREVVILSQTSSTNYGPDSATSEVIVSRNNSINNGDGDNICTGNTDALSPTTSPKTEDGTGSTAAAAAAPTTPKMMKVRCVSAPVSNTAAAASTMTVTTTPTEGCTQ